MNDGKRIFRLDAFCLDPLIINIYLSVYGEALRCSLVGSSNYYDNGIRRSITVMTSVELRWGIIHVCMPSPILSLQVRRLEMYFRLDIPASISVLLSSVLSERQDLDGVEVEASLSRL